MRSWHKGERSLLSWLEDEKRGGKVAVPTHVPLCRLLMETWV